MTTTVQTVLALGAVVAAVGFLLWRALRRPGSACDDAGCGCGKGGLKKAGTKKPAR